VATTAEPTAASDAAPAKPKLTLLQRLAKIRGTLRKSRGATSSATVTPLYPPSPFALWGFEDANEAVSDAVAHQTIDVAQRAVATIGPSAGEVRFQPARRTQDPIVVNRAFYLGDHWQYGSGYIGPHPAIGDTAFQDAMTEISLIFTSKNAIKEVVDRHAAGVIGKPFRWALVPRRATGDQKPTTEEQTAIDAASGIIRDWLNARKVSTLMLDATATLLLAERSSIRLYTPYGLTEAGADGMRSVVAASIEQALTKIWPEHNQPESATVACDDDTKLEAGVVRYEGAADAYDDDSDGDSDETNDYAWLCFLNRVGETVIRILSDDDAEPEKPAADAPDQYTPQPGDATLKLGGRLAMFEMRRPALVTPQVQQNQRALNFALTMVPRNVTTGGFVERLLLDAAVPGAFQDDGKGGKVFIPSPLKLGAGTTNIIEGINVQETNDQGEKVVKHASPSVVFREPVKPDASIAAADEHYDAILAETGQRHVLITGDATSSAVSRIQARAEYLNTLLKSKTEVESAFTWLIETALAMAEAIAGQAGQYTSLLRVQGSCKLDTGPITPEERKAIEASIGVTISQDTAMLMLDVDDVDAEKSRMAADPASRYAGGEALGKALQAITTAGATLEGAAKVLGLTPAQVKDLLTPETYAALPGGVSVKQPKPGAAGEVIEPQAALEEPRAASTAVAIDTAPNPAAAAAVGAKGTKASSSPGSTAGGGAPGGAAA
jgi:hypothetical protein